jgi:predicted AlkP superfamily pyrophosphatase or phosphodiesterase
MRILLILCCLVLPACSPVSPSQPTTRPAGRTTVVWVSIDGLRGDYFDRLAMLQRERQQGYYSSQVKPSFPSLTFPNHISQVTGVGVDRNGVPGNSWFDSADGKIYSFANDSKLLRAEPIWGTAKRQGVRTAVIGWPMSYQQTGPHASDYFDAAFNRNEADDGRLQRLGQLLVNDNGQQPVRLVMTYLSELDTTGHKVGPDELQALQIAAARVQITLAEFQEVVGQYFERHRRPGDELYFVITTDHGMETVHTLVNPERLVGDPAILKGAQIGGGGPMRFVTLSADQKPRAPELVAKLRAYPFVSAWEAKDVPAEYHFSDPTRIGDIVVLLSPGYNFHQGRAAATQPVGGGQKGAHGYDPAVSPAMLGGAVIWKYGAELGGKDLGPIDNTQWHATVAKMLGIQPAEGADPRAIPLP